MNCVNIYCDNDPNGSPSASIANTDGELACCASCMRAYEKQNSDDETKGLFEKMAEEAMLITAQVQAVEKSRDIFVAHAMTVLKQFPNDVNASAALESYERYKVLRDALT